jgi:formylglycine-generating enzyme required for sulfatase activity
MTIARNAEKLGSNWCDSNGTNCGFSPGQSGKKLASGHNDSGNEAAAGGDTSSAIIASADDSQACYGTTTNGSNTCGGTGSQKRTLTLSNGEVVWDMAGNVWQWTDNTISSAQPSSTFTANTWNWSGFTSDGAAGYLTGWGSLSYDAIQPSNSSWNANQGVGRIYHYNGNPSGPYAFLRGGGWNFGSYAGAFAVGLDNSPGDSGVVSVGFRCVVPLQ